jgi:hypothetical protein
MKTGGSPGVVSDAAGDFARVMKDPVALDLRDRRRNPQENLLPRRINLEPDNPKNGLAQLVLVLVKLLHELLERQGIRRIEAGSLNEAEIENLGLTLMRQAQELDRLRQEFGLEEEDLNLDLGPLGTLL